MQLRLQVLPDSTRRRLMSVHVGYTVTDSTVPHGGSGTPTVRLTQSYTPTKPLQINHHMLDAAREALKPLRELHRPLDRPISWGNTQTERVCHHCLGPVKWPCLTARLVYSSEELS